MTDFIVNNALLHKLKLGITVFLSAITKFRMLLQNCISYYTISSATTLFN